MNIRPEAVQSARLVFCGMKGHISKTCPNRYAAGAKEIDNYNDCDRCGSEIHKTNECPTLWRIYEYLGDDDRESTLRLREKKRKLGLGKGGEGYIALDEWCYNCGDCGHLGDDCKEVPHLSDISQEPSAFSVYNTMSGPFEPLAELKPSTSCQREPRDWERDSLVLDASVNGGKERRKRVGARMAWKAKQQEANDDSDGWFGNPRDVVPNRPPLVNGGKEPPPGVKKLSLVVKDAGRRFQPPSSHRHTEGGNSGGRNYDRPSHSGGTYNQDSSYSSKRRSEGREGPRYRGGYSR